MARAPILAGDVGGTKSNLRLVSPSGETLAQQRFESAKYPHLAAIVSAFLDADAGGHGKPEVGAFGVAGPVVDGVCQTTNLPWHLDERELAKTCGLARVKLMNDFEATAYGIVELPAESRATLQQGEPRASGTRAVIGAGTGLGEALVVMHGEAALVVASEGGHADFSPRDEVEIALLRWLRGKHGHVSWERVVSGIGIRNVYGFLKETGVVAESAAIAKEMTDKDPNAVIGAHALAGDDPLCVRTIDLFVGCYGAEAGNLALKGLATGGVFITGGIAPKLLPKLKEGGFLRAFHDKGRLSPVVEKTPVHVVLDQEIPLRGAAYVATRLSAG